MGRPKRIITDDQIDAALAEAAANGSVVYFVSHGGYVKVGTTRNLPKRLSELQLAMPFPLIFEGVIRGNATIETVLHRKWAEHHVRGEWFYIDPKIRQFMRDHVRTP